MDDESSVLALVAEVLRREGYEVMAAAGGAEALHVARSAGWRVDLLVTDVTNATMPTVSGAELAAYLRLRVPGLPVLFVSGWFSDTELAARVECGQVHYLRKPFTLAELREKVKLVLRSKV